MLLRLLFEIKVSNYIFLKYFITVCFLYTTNVNDTKCKKTNKFTDICIRLNSKLIKRTVCVFGVHLVETEFSVHLIVSGAFSQHLIYTTLVKGTNFTLLSYM